MTEQPDVDNNSKNNSNEDSPQQQQQPSSSSFLAVASPFAKRAGHYMHWKNISMTAVVVDTTTKGNGSNGNGNADGKSSTKQRQPSQTEKKAILNHITGSAPSGQVTAIMGPSGSGKTSLLNVLSGRVDTVRNKISVQHDGILLDNQNVDPAHDITIRQRIAFVAQDDSLPVTATPREAILFSARLRLPKTMNMTELIELTNTMLTELHLQDCADTVVGGHLVKGLSGGERKRTSVGVELVTQPNIVFADEPTSGLDSFNALELCQVLHKVATAGSAVLMTIHQPSSDIFTSLDRLILLNKGQVMFQGKAESVVDYFAARGYPCPEHHNPADWILGISQSKTVAQLTSDGFFSADEDTLPLPQEEQDENAGTMDVENDQDDNTNNNNSSRHSIGLVADKERVGLWVQVQLLFQREIQNFVRNKKALMARTGMTLMVSILGGIIFYQVADRDFDEFINVQTTFGALLLSMLANVFSTALPSLVAFPEERPVFIREYSTNHYSVTAYFMSRLSMELLVTGVQVTVSSVLTYFLVGYKGPFGPFWACLYALALTSTALGVLLGCSVKDPGVAVELLPLVLMPQILFAGFFTPPDLIPAWLRWVGYLFPLTYSTRIVLVNELDGRCEGLFPNFCQMVLDNVNADPDDVWWYWLILLGQMAFFRLLALFVLKRKASSFY